MTNPRANRVAGLLKQIISDTIMLKIKNPKAKQATVHQVKVTDNLKHVKIYVSIFGSPEEREAGLSALRGAKGFFKQQISEQATLRFMPELEFVLDDSLDQADRIEQLLRSIKKK